MIEFIGLEIIPFIKDVFQSLYSFIMTNVLTPHNARNTKESDENIFRLSVDNVKLFVAWTPQNVVN